MTVDDLLRTAAEARAAAPAPGDERYERYCTALADRLARHWDDVLAANTTDVAAAGGLGAELVGRLTLGKAHLAALTAITDEVRRSLPAVTAPTPPRPAAGGMTVRRLPKPLGVLLMIFEARPTVTVEGALLPVSVGNAAILRGGTEIAATNAALAEVIRAALADAGLPAGLVQVVADPGRRLVRELLARHDGIDALIPRGSPSLIDHCVETSRIPVIASGGGVNHLYVDRSADLDLAAAIALDSKLGEPTACNTLELALVHHEVAADFTRSVLRAGAASPEPWLLRLDPRLPGERGPGRPSVADLAPADDGREFLERSLGVRPVSGVDEAVAHIRRHGSRHTEGVVAADPAVIQRFLDTADAAALVVNGSLRLHDGPTMGLGPELSISTGRLHVRGPVALPALLTHTWLIQGLGTLRDGGAA